MRNGPRLTCRRQNGRSRRTNEDATLHLVPFSRQAIAILNELRPKTGRSRVVFPSARSFERPMSDNAMRPSTHTKNRRTPIDNAAAEITKFAESD